MDAAPDDPQPPAEPSAALRSDLATAPLDGRYHPLDPRVIPLQRITGGLFAMVVALGIFLTTPVLVLGTGSLGLLLPALAIWFVITALLGWWAWAWPAVRYRYASYKVDADGIEIRRGVVFRTVINVPRSRVQHTDVSQGPLERSHGLGTLVIYTAGTAFARVALAGLDHGVALRIRDHLLPQEPGDVI